MVACIVYTSENNHWSRRFLHPEVNHCFICFMCNGVWLSLDPVYNGMEYKISKDIPKGSYIQRVKINRKLTPILLTSCVGIIKHLIGIRNPFVITPWQLLKAIENEETKSTKTDSSTSSYGTKTTNATG